ncbi:MAG: ABC transporter ATP-binding protein [bacterium]|nr:ABC transporter ATP-binding protein [bacterium]
MAEYILETRGITKHFPGVLANDNVEIKIRQGEIHSIIGENGAGKTTLMNIIYGLIRPDRGEIFYRGKKVEISSPSIAIRLGIGMVHQHFMLVPPFTAWENIILGKEVIKNGVLDKDSVCSELKRLMDSYGLSVPLEERVEDLSVGIRQKVELIKLLYRGAELLILDEPTALLVPQEIEELFEILDNLKKQGKTVIFISHKLKEVLRISDRITVMRRGKVVGELEREEANEETLARLMIGKTLESPQLEVYERGEEVLRLEGISLPPKLRNINLSLYKGEILGLAGIEGNGQKELLEIITGLLRPEKGRIFYKNREVQHLDPKSLRELGIGFIPEDRQTTGLILDFTVAENIILGRHDKEPYSIRGKLNLPTIKKTAVDIVKDYDIRASSVDKHVRFLSGGNQQKVILGREFYFEPEVLIASQPTRGLDIGATEMIHNLLLSARRRGMAILLYSSDLDEIMTLSDRVAVIYNGEIVGILSPREIDEATLGLYMTGVRKD